MKEELALNNVTSVDAILFDLGVSSPQLDEVERGFSFMHDADLDMRMDQTQDFKASDVVNNYSLENLVNIFYLFGEERLSKAIAKEIIDKRPIKTTLELVKVIEEAVGKKYFNINHPERRIFQAIRIEVNSELKVIESTLPDAIDLLSKGGRISVITFHSLEDRMVKTIFKKNSDVNELVKGLPEIPEEYKPKVKLINKHPILPSEEELKENSRSKSAKLRIIERL
jgi:16S rRNA (cytosine1402-N4)-methyltransferase